jgi:hypothetical protein
MHERVFAEGGAACAAAVATCAQVLTHVVGLFGGTALRSCDARCLRWHLRLDNSAINSLTTIVFHEGPLFYELHSTVISCQIFIRLQSLIAR